MATTPPNLGFDHQKGFEIPTKHKEAIRQLYWFAKVPKLQLQGRYHLGRTTINRILSYDKPERARPTRTGAPEKLTDLQVDSIIEYCSEKWENRCLDWQAIVRELKLACKANTLMRRMHQSVTNQCLITLTPWSTGQKGTRISSQLIRNLLYTLRIEP